VLVNHYSSINYFSFLFSMETLDRNKIQGIHVQFERIQFQL